MRARLQAMIGRCRNAAGRRIVTFGAVATGRDNNLNLLRMIAAAMVLFSHSYALTGHIADEPLAVASGRMTDVATVGVVIFFAISGFLIAQSLTRNPSMYAYAVHRFLRIMPGLVLATIFAVAIVGWTATTQSSGEYWRSDRTWGYLLGTPALRLSYRLPGVFETNPYPYAVNGSLWTIPLEVWCYVVLAVVAALRILRVGWLFTALAAATAIAFAYFPASIVAAIPIDGPFTAPRLAGTFLLGACIFVNRHRVPVSIVLAAAAAVGVVALARTAYGGYAYYGGIAYIALVVAYHPRLRLRAYLRAGDYSYGTYVLAFPIQQFIVWRFALGEPLALFAAASVATLSLAALSWHFVEQPALAQKQRLSAWRPRLPLGWRMDAKP